MAQLSAFASFIVRGVSHKSETQTLMKSPSKELTVKVVLSNFFSFTFCFLKNLCLVFGPQLSFLLLSFHMKLHHFFSFEALQGSLGGCLH